MNLRDSQYKNGIEKSFILLTGIIFLKEILHLIFLQLPFLGFSPVNITYIENTVFHHLSYYWLIAFFVGWVFTIFLKKDIKKIIQKVIKVFLVLLIIPVMELWIRSPSGLEYPPQLGFAYFVYYLNPVQWSSAVPFMCARIKVEFLIIGLTVAFLIYRERKNILNSFFSFALIYAILIFLKILPLIFSFVISFVFRTPAPNPFSLVFLQGGIVTSELRRYALFYVLLLTVFYIILIIKIKNLSWKKIGQVFPKLFNTGFWSVFIALLFSVVMFKNYLFLFHNPFDYIAVLVLLAVPLLFNISLVLKNRDFGFIGGILGMFASFSLDYATGVLFISILVLYFLTNYIQEILGRKKYLEIIFKTLYHFSFLLLGVSLFGKDRTFAVIPLNGILLSILVFLCLNIYRFVSEKKFVSSILLFVPILLSPLILFRFQFIFLFIFIGIVIAILNFFQKNKYLVYGGYIVYGIIVALIFKKVEMKFFMSQGKNVIESLAHFYNGEFYRLAGNDFVASEEYKEALKSGLYVPLLYYNYGMVLKKLGRYHKALSVLGAFKNPKNYFLFPYGLLEYALLLKYMQDFKKAIEIIDVCIQHNYHTAEAYLLKGEVLLSLEQPEDAKEQFLKAYVFGYDKSKVWKRMGDAFLIKGDKKSAEKFYKRSIQANYRNMEAYIDLVSLYWKQGRIMDAYRLSLKGNEVFPKSYVMKYLIARCLEMFGRPYQALEFYRRSIMLNPNFIASYERMGELLEELKRYEDALKVYEEGLNKNPHSGVLKNRLNRLKEKLEE